MYNDEELDQVFAPTQEENPNESIEQAQEENVSAPPEQSVTKKSKFQEYLDSRYEKRAQAGKSLTAFQKLKKKFEEKRKLEDAETDSKKIKRIRRKRDFFQAIKYFIFAASAGGIQVGTYALFYEVFHWVAWLSYLISLVLSVLWNFTFNRKFTFKSANNIPIAMLKVAAYYAVFTPLSTFWTGALTTGVNLGKISLSGVGVNAWAIEVPTLLINGITEFLYQKFFVFNEKKSKKTVERKSKKTNKSNVETNV